MKRYILAFALIVFATPANAEQLVQMSEDGSGSIYYSDYDSVRGSGQSAQVWIFVDHSGNKSNPARSTRELWKYNCGERTSITLSYTDYDKSGSVLKSGSQRDNSYRYEPVTPRTVGERALNFACSSIGHTDFTQ